MSSHVTLTINEATREQIDRLVDVLAAAVAAERRSASEAVGV